MIYIILWDPFTTYLIFVLDYNKLTEILLNKYQGTNFAKELVFEEPLFKSRIPIFINTNLVLYFN